MPIPAVQVMLGGGVPGLLPVTLAYMGTQQMTNNVAKTFDFGEAQDDRYIVVANAVLGNFGSFGSCLVNGAATTTLTISGIVQNMRATIHIAAVPLGATGTVTLTGIGQGISHVYRATGLEEGATAAFTDGASYVFPGGDPQPMQCQTGPHSMPANSFTVGVAADSSGVTVNQPIWGGITRNAFNASSSTASRLDAVAANVGAFSYFHQAAGAVIFRVACVAGP